MTNSSTRPPRAIAAAALLLLFAPAAWACAADGGAEPIAGFRELATPAASGSGEAHLALDGSDVIMSWLEPLSTTAHSEGEEGNRHALRMARLSGGVWGEPRLVAESDSFFVNWADFPSVVPVAPGLLAAHWLVRGVEGGYDYAVHIALSADDGRSWGEAWTPHEDGTPTEHGFVSMFPLGEGEMGVIWLDGRDYAAAAEEGGERRPEMALRFRRASLDPADGSPLPSLPEGAGEEVVVDARVCDCCQTAAARTSRGVIAVYRDRSGEEVRDISVVRLDGGGEWSPPAPVHVDGWVINACPVNGPAIGASDERVGVAWFTGADDIPRVRAAFSSDAGMTFEPPIEIDGGNPAGRTAIALLPDGSAVVSWLERVDDGAEVRVRRVSADGGAGPARVVAHSTAARASGFPQMVVVDGELVFAWTDPSDSEGAGRVRVAMAALPPLP